MTGYTIREYNKISTWCTITEFLFITHMDVLDVFGDDKQQIDLEGVTNPILLVGRISLLSAVGVDYLESLRQ